MKANNPHCLLVIFALVLSIPSLLLILANASDEPYTAFHGGQAILHIGVAMVLMTLWVQLGLAIAVLVVRKRLTTKWLFFLLWVALCVSVLFDSPNGYVKDLAFYTAFHSTTPN
jgi:hypothetical protein